MKPIDFAKAAGIAIAILALNILISILAVLAYSIFIEPGHPREFYDEAALRIAPWCSHIFGTALFFGAGYLSQATWWRIGFLLSIVHVSIWLPIGLLWWKIIGLW